VSRNKGVRAEISGVGIYNVWLCPPDYTPPPDINIVNYWDKTTADSTENNSSRARGQRAAAPGGRQRRGASGVARLERRRAAAPWSVGCGSLGAPWSVECGSLVGSKKKQVFKERHHSAHFAR
jgi:hypothetical protein